MSKSKEVSSVLKTQASKEYRQLLQAADKTVDKYAHVVSRAIGKDKDEIASEIQSIYLDNLRKADNPVSLLKENLVNLMLKKQTSDYLKEHLHKKALAEAESLGDDEGVKKIEAEMMEDLFLNEFDLKVHKAINESVKVVEKSEPRKVTKNSNRYDDNQVFDIK